MNKTVLSSIFSLLLVSGFTYAKEVKQTICFAKSSCTDKYAYGTLGENVALCGGKCHGKTLLKMNKSGWKLIQVVGGLQSGFGMVLEKD